MISEQAAFSIGAAQRFADKFADISSERQHAQNFWRELFGSVCGVADVIGSGIEFERPVRSSTTGRVGFIDVFWPGVLLAEHKSTGKDLASAEQQARDYLISLEARERPPVVIVSDFARIRIIEVLAGNTVEFALADLPNNLHRLQSVIGDAGRGAAHVELQADIRAAELMAALWAELDKVGYGGHASAVFAVRLLFLLFCDDAGVFPRGQFNAFLQQSPESGTGLGAMLAELFDVLNTPRDKRVGVPPELDAFPYVNGRLFDSDTLRMANFSREMRAALLEAAAYDWSGISPSVFGSLFQAARDPKTRRALGEHYTSPANILKTLGGLLGDLEARLLDAWDSAPRLRDFLRHLGNVKVADFAAGSGNFLVVAYRRMRDLEVRARVRLRNLTHAAHQEAWEFEEAAFVSVRNFYGVEIDEFSSAIARVALWLTAQQANIAQERLLGTAPDLLPLRESANIVTGNALHCDWSEVLGLAPGERCDTLYIIGNPPFIGSHLQTTEQKSDQMAVWAGVRGAGDLDFVTCWFLLAARVIHGHGGRAALVASNSVSQGQSPPVLWGELSRLGMSIDFAHRSFVWSNDAPGVAAVHTVVIGFSRTDARSRPLFQYPDPKGPPIEHRAANINAYLLDAPNVLVTARSRPLLQGTPTMEKGNIPADGGHLADISPEEARRIRTADPIAAKYLRRLVGARELIHGIERWCLWLKDANPTDIRTSSELSRRVTAVREMRSSSPKAQTRADALRAHEFQEIRQPSRPYIAVPLHSSENRDYVPLAWLGPEVISNNALSVVSDAPLWLFAFLNSSVFNVWNKAVSGRIKSDTRISNTITYNNFPMPTLTAEAEALLTKSAQAIIEARAEFPAARLADLYGEVSMPSALRSAHRTNDIAVLKLFGLPPGATGEAILARLFQRYAESVSGLLPSPPTHRRRTR